MKKLILIVLLLLATSCNKFIVQNVYEKTYNAEVTALTDVYHQLDVYGSQQIPLDLWITNNVTNDTIQLQQKIVIKNINDKSMYQFIYTKYTYPKSSSFKFLIRYSGKEKDLK